jgi:hypothetical protein
VLTSSQERSRFPVAFLIGVIIVGALVAGAVVLSRYSEPAGPHPLRPLPMGPAEQAYAGQIQFLDPKMSRAANFLNQEVTFIFGTVKNGGSRQIRQIEVTLEFHDVFNQVVLRDKQRLFPPRTPPIAPGEQRDFELAYEHVPAQWNQVYPTMRITGLDLK